MINVGLQVRRAVVEDHQQIANLMFYEANVHRHLDWRTPLDWLGSPNYWVLEDGGRIVAGLACPEDPPQVAWIRLFGYLTHLPAADAWLPLWEAVRATATRMGQTQIAAIVIKHWFQNLLLASGFKLAQNIVLLDLRGENFKPFKIPQGVQIRTMTAEDIPTVERIDLEAFGGFWHNSHDALQRARSQAMNATVAEDSSGVIVGYQISTGSPFGAHLARLGVVKEAQGKGIGAALVSELVRELDPKHMARLSVNTQSDNMASLALYKKLGFIRTGEHYPVLVYSER
ncbi:MAG: GNAT family N-acetyltransferase [Anaerolineales bacterium]